jgi:predicted PurR-regulated permease PerM
MDAFEILVIILSTFLAIFLLLAIIVLTGIIKLVKQVRHITEKAEEVIDNVEEASELFKKSASTLTFANLVSNIVSKVNEFSGKKGKK